MPCKSPRRLISEPWALAAEKSTSSERRADDSENVASAVMQCYFRSWAIASPAVAEIGRRKRPWAANGF